MARLAHIAGGGVGEFLGSASEMHHCPGTWLPTSFEVQWHTNIAICNAKMPNATFRAKKCLILAWWKQVSQANFAYFCHKNHQLQIKQFMAVCHCKNCSPFTIVCSFNDSFFHFFPKFTIRGFYRVQQNLVRHKKIRMMLMLSISNHPSWNGQ